MTEIEFNVIEQHRWFLAHRNEKSTGWTSDMAGSRTSHDAMGTPDLYFSVWMPFSRRLSLRGDKDGYKLSEDTKKKCQFSRVLEKKKISGLLSLALPGLTSIPDAIIVVRQMGCFDWPSLGQEPTLWSMGWSQPQTNH